MYWSGDCMKKKTKFEEKNVLLILGIIYALITILAVVSYVSKMNNISTTPVTVGSVFAAVWWQLLMIVLFAATYILYTKRTNLGILLEIIMGISMLIYILISVWSMGFNFFALIIELIYPLILVNHGLIQLKKTNKKVKEKQKNKKSTK